jgi:pyruvate/2-oxoglutarate/acetoin dehydrogenase E1 component
MRAWMIKAGVATGETLDQLEAENKQIVEDAKTNAWQAYLAPIKKEIEEVNSLIEKIAETSEFADELRTFATELSGLKEPQRRDIFSAVNKLLRKTSAPHSEHLMELAKWRDENRALNDERYSSHVYSESVEAARKIEEVKPTYASDAAKVDGRQVLQACFDAALTRDPRVFAIGEDIGTIGDVNLAFEGLQAKHGLLRVTDTGIREATILGQGIGAAMRGLRPIVEIQYLDYLLYALETMSDDLATLQWRTMGGQKAPVIVRTRGHRLEGVWHSGSPMGMILSALRGMLVLVPRNMTQAAGFYNTMLASDDTAIIIEVLSGYRLKEVIPSNIGDYRVPVGIPEVLREGTDITLVTYGACCRIAMEAARELDALGISLEVIDVQSLLPFDVYHSIGESLKRTNRVIFFDEDVPGGATSFMLREILETQDGYRWLDSKPITITAKAHRAAYGSDGDYFSKPQADDVIDAAIRLMHEADPAKFRAIL